MNPSRRHQGWAAALVAATALATTVASGPAAHAGDARRTLDPVPGASARTLEGLSGTLARPDRAAVGRQSYFVRFAGPGAADLAAHSSAGRRAVRDRRAAVERQANDALDSARAADASAAPLFVVANALPGMGIRVDATGLRALAARADVVKVSRIVPKTVENANTAALVKALDTWKFPGGTGSGVDVGIIDTGIDYTHADFGGPGTPGAYDTALGASADPDWHAGLPARGQAKVVGGYDFAGDDYNADPTDLAYQPFPNPDANPLDCNEHGTHVAGTAAGYGVSSDGSTFDGDYAAQTASSLMDMKVGPGMAPEANLYGLKVFGCAGSTDLVIEAMDWALDPNEDGDFSDHLDVINMSLGSAYGFVDDPEADVVAELADHGVLSVISMGNNGDLTDSGGAPGNAVSSLAVASSVDAYQLRDGLTVKAPAGVSGTAAGQMSVAYDWATEPPVSGTVAAIPGSNADGCDALSGTDAAKVNGKVAWLVWDDDDSTRRCRSLDQAANVRTAGAIGAILTSGKAVFGGGITGDEVIPVFQLPKAEVTRLQSAVTAGTLQVTFDGALRASIQEVTPSLTDTLSSFTSRGPHGSLGVVKPDVAAPGDTIASALVGSGSDPVAFSGTSMAAPLIAGVSALVKSRHPGWTPVMVKAAVMNTAGNDLWTKPSRKGVRYAPARVGAGRVDALRATSTKVLAYVTKPGDAVSASFGVVPAKITKSKVTKTRTLKVVNTGTKKVTVSLRYQAVNAAAGVAYSVSPGTLTVQPGSSAKAVVKMTVLPGKLRHTLDKTMAKLQAGAPRQFVSDGSGRVLVTPRGGQALRVPVYGAAKPVSTTHSSVLNRQIVNTGARVAQGSGASAYRSIMSVMQLGATSGVLPTCDPGEPPIGCTSLRSERAGDIRAIGAGSTSDTLWFGVTTEGDWANTGNVLQPYVDFDVDGDHDPDFETFVTNYPGTDVLLAVTVDLHDPTADPLSLAPVNGVWADTDTNVFDTNVILLPVPREAIGLTSTTSTPITYTAAVSNGYTGEPIDQVAATAAFDVAKPGVKTSSMLWLDSRGVIPYTAKSSTRALVFHLHGAKGARSEVLNLPSHP